MEHDIQFSIGLNVGDAESKDVSNMTTEELSVFIWEHTEEERNALIERMNVLAQALMDGDIDDYV